MPFSILVVDDCPGIREFMVEALAEVPEALVCAASCLNAAEVVLTTATHPVDIILMDVGLPDGDGRAFCATLRKRGVSTPIVLMSGLAGDNAVAAGFAAGADKYLTKPFGLRELLECVNIFRQPTSPFRHSTAM